MGKIIMDSTASMALQPAFRLSGENTFFFKLKPYWLMIKLIKLINKIFQCHRKKKINWHYYEYINRNYLFYLLPGIGFFFLLLHSVNRFF